MVSFLQTLLALPLLVLFLFMKYKTNIKNSSSTFPKGPKGLPIIGNLHQLDISNLHIQFLNLSKFYGPLFSLQIGFKKAIVISTPQLAQQILKDHDHGVSSRPPSHGTQKLSYNGIDMIFSPYNDCWREIRKICVVHFFSSKKISSFSPIRKSELYDYIPFMGWIDKLTGSIARVDNTFKSLDAFFEQVLKEHLDPNNRKREEEEKDIVDVLLELKNQGHLSIHLTNDHIKAVLMNLLVAATDTSAATSVWVMTALMKNPRAMKKAQEEIRNICGKKEFIDEDDIQKLVYLKAVIKETLRYYPPVPLAPRETNKSFILNGYKIEPKTLLYVNIWAIHRDPETWKDPDEFYPERFLNNDVDFKGLDFELIPFGGGRRICPGIPLAIAMQEMVTANLLNSFDWEMPEGMRKEDIDIEGLPGLARHKKNHLCLVAKNHM
ncbi:unnamed protein product [Vicia faba]|uniref:Cytochrome P450 n=1 Tax=Vicia faba TaxID=3906 RepID=A0AAV0Z081_VICFA|nr:unnamed protein product [Vicia faba]